MKCNSCGETWKSTRGEYTCPFCGSDNSMTPEEISAVTDAARVAFEEKRYEEAAAGFLSAAERGDADAACRYATCLERGLGVAKSTREALVWLKSATLLGSGEAAGRFYRILSGFRFARDSSTNLELWLKIAAELGDPRSLEACGDLFLSDKSGEFQPRRALWCYARAAELSGGGAAKKMARLLSEGSLVERDENGAAAYQQIAERSSILSKITRVGRAEQANEPSVPSEKYTYEEYPEDVFKLALAAASAHEYEISVLLYRRAADLGHVRAINCLGVCLERGRGVDADPTEALRLYTVAAEAGNALACLNLGDCYRRGVGVDADGVAAFGWYLRAAELGNLHAQYTVANCYFEGRYTERDPREALRWYEAAAMGSHPKAIARADELRRRMTSLYNTGVAAYEAGNYEEAFKCYASAAAFGHVGAICNLGILCQLGLGCKVDRRAAAGCYRMAADEGSAAAAYNLGLCYLKGEGVPYSYREAKKYLSIAAEAGREEARPLIEQAERNKKKKQLRALYSLAASLQYKGKLSDAVRLRALAAELGHARAAFLLGCHFEFGYGIKADPGHALVCYDRAADLGFESRTMKGAFLKATRAMAEKNRVESNGAKDE